MAACIARPVCQSVCGHKHKKPLIELLADAIVYSSSQIHRAHCLCGYDTHDRRRRDLLPISLSDVRVCKGIKSRSILYRGTAIHIVTTAKMFASIARSLSHYSFHFYFSLRRLPLLLLLLLSGSFVLFVYVSLPQPSEFFDKPRTT